MFFSEFWITCRLHLPIPTLLHLAATPPELYTQHSRVSVMHFLYWTAYVNMSLMYLFFFFSLGKYNSVSGPLMVSHNCVTSNSKSVLWFWGCTPFISFHRREGPVNESRKHGSNWRSSCPIPKRCLPFKLTIQCTIWPEWSMRYNAVCLLLSGCMNVYHVKALCCS